MSALQTAQDLTRLAESRAPADRERLMLALADLCAELNDAMRRPQVQALLGEIFLSLVSGAEQDIRRALAERLARADWPPADLVNALAMDEIEIARPVIASSPVLTDADLVRLLIEATVDHQIEVAQRPSIGAPVVDTIVRQAEPSVMTALAGNDTADISPRAMAQLVEASRQIAAMRSPLARHPRLTSELAQRLYLWVGQSLRTAIVTRFQVDAAALDQALAEAVRQAQTQAGESQGQRINAEQADMERRLVAKLYNAGQLRPSYLLRALREQRLSLFVTALAVLGGYSLDQVRKAIDADRADVLALACLSVGVDRGAFSTLLALVRDLNEGRPGGDIAVARKVFSALTGDNVGKAAAAFRSAIDAV
ncbi:MAG: DUF2336 domain-containing protein [Caulobacteraceae bacterium]|nr:DUF2336 domain-containing protein [Caulobacteraceae bacterium]